MAHSYVMAHEDELQAFRAFVGDFPDRPFLLIDTFDVEEGARRAAQVFKEQKGGFGTRGVRIDSGELADLAFAVRKILDEQGLYDVKIMFSGDLDEYRIEKFLRDGVPVDAFGVGTQMGTSGDAPSLGSVYKLVADSRGPKVKLSTGKATLPGCKQVYRFEEGGPPPPRPHRSRVGTNRRRKTASEESDDVGNPWGSHGDPGHLARAVCAFAQQAAGRAAILERAETQYPVERSPDLQRLFEQIRGQAR